MWYRAWVCSVAAVFALVAVPAMATPQQIAWPTFFRAAPSHDGDELQELDRGETVDVLDCNADQCRVQYGRVIGYVDKAMLAPPNTPPAALMPANVAGPRPDAPKSCVAAKEAGFGSGLTYDYCHS
jgi:hypothetical protein